MIRMARSTGAGLPPADWNAVWPSVAAKGWAARDRIRSIFASPSNTVLRRLLLDQGAKHWKGYASAFVMMALIAVTTALSAWIIGKIVDKIFVGRSLTAVWEITAAIVVIYTVKGMATYGQQVVLSRVAKRSIPNPSRRSRRR